MGTVTITNHPMIQHKLSILRRKETGTQEFRTLVSEIAMLECYEATRDFPLQPVNIETPIGPCVANEIAGKKVCVVPILRAGLGMVDGMLTLIPSAKVGHIGMSMAANKVKGIRAAACSDTFSARFTRMHNDANVLCLGGRVVGPGLAIDLVDLFLNTEFEGGRHQRRVDKVMAIENK